MAYVSHGLYNFGLYSHGLYTCIVMALVKGCGALYLLPAEVEYVFDLPPAVSATANHAAEYSRRDEETREALSGPLGFV